MSASQAAGYRLLGGGFDYLLHLRPAEWPIMAAHTAVGYLLAAGIDGAVEPARLAARRCSASCSGSSVSTAGRSRSTAPSTATKATSPICEKPPPPPRELAALQPRPHGARAGCSLRCSRCGTLAAYALCFLLSVLYSVPPVRLKAVAGADWLINMWGFGTLTPYAGWVGDRASRSMRRARLVLLAFCPLFAALYPLTQLYQLEEDRRRGDRTLAAVLGVRPQSRRRPWLAAALAFALLRGGRRPVGVELEWRALAVALRWRLRSRGVGSGAGAVAPRGRPHTGPTSTSAACTGRSRPGPSPTSRSSWPGRL